MFKLNAIDVGGEKHSYCNAPAIAKSRTICFKDNKVARIQTCSKSLSKILKHKFKFVGMNSDSDVWPRICRLK